MLKTEFIETKTNLYGDPELCLNKDSLLRDLPDIVECYKVEFMRTMRNYSTLPYHALMAVAPLFKVEDVNYAYSDHVTPLPDSRTIGDELEKLAGTIFSEIPPPAPRYSITRWFKVFGHNKFFFIRGGYVYFGFVFAARGFQDRVSRPASIVRIDTKKVIDKATVEIEEFASSHFNVVAGNFNPYNVKLNSRENVAGFCKVFLKGSIEARELSKEYESKMAAIAQQIKQLEASHGELAIEYGHKARKLVDQKMDKMKQSDGSNQAQLDVMRGRLHNLPLGSWVFKG